MRLQFPVLFSMIAVLPVGCNRDQGATQHASARKEAAVVIVRAADGRAITMADLEGLTGTFQYEIVGNANVPAEADSLHKQARQVGRAGDYKKAIALLDQASGLAPAWPYPVYDMAFTYLLIKDMDNARKYYRKAIDLSPRGFFTAITALETLDREAQGELPTGTYLAYLSLEWMDDAGKKADAIRQLVKRVPRFASGWKELAMQLNDDAEKLAAIEKGLAAIPDGETKGILLINKAMILERSGNHDGAVQLLGELALDPASTFGTEQLAKFTLAGIVKQ